jgi:hypothetical protein
MVVGVKTRASSRTAPPIRKHLAQVVRLIREYLQLHGAALDAHVAAHALEENIGTSGGFIIGIGKELRSG